VAEVGGGESLEDYEDGVAGYGVGDVVIVRLFSVCRTCFVSRIVKCFGALPLSMRMGFVISPWSSDKVRLESCSMPA